MLSTVFLMLLLPPSLLSEQSKCRIVLEEQVQCQPRLGQDSCVPGCRTETFEECRQVEPEDCTTQYETKCGSSEEQDSSRRRKRSLVPIGLSGLGLAKLTALKLIVAKALKAKHSPHAATIAALHTAETARNGAVNIADAILDSTVRMGEAKLHGVAGFVQAGVDGIVNFGDATLGSVRQVGGATIAGVANAGKAALDGAHLVAESKLGHHLSDVCFQIPRTVCNYRRSAHGLEKSSDECSTSVQTVCGVDSRLVDPRLVDHQHRRRRSVETDGEGCVKVPVSQMCTKRKEVETVCETVNKEVCTDCKESTVCTPKKVQREVCED